MSDETEARSAGAVDRGRSPDSRGAIGSPLQSRAAFLKNWGWESVIRINRGACERGGAQHGINSETGGTCASDWEGLRTKELGLGDCFDRLREFHRKHPFHFFNGNTFATIGRELSLALFSDIPAARKREVASAIGHYIAGVLDRESMVEIIESLCQAASFRVGQRVKTFRGSSHGLIVRLMEDGRVLWRPDGSGAELMALPETLIPVDIGEPEEKR